MEFIFFVLVCVHLQVEARRMSPHDLQLGLDALQIQVITFSYIYRSSIVTTTVVIPNVNKQFFWKKVSQLEALAEREVNRKDEWKAKIKDIRYHIKYV
jgi:hypothetical protein